MKTTMLEQTKRNLLGGALLLLVSLGAYGCQHAFAFKSGLDTQKANQLVEESNAVRAEAARLAGEASSKLDVLTTEKTAQGPQSTQVASPAATREVVDLYGSAATHFRQAAEKLEPIGALHTMHPAFQETISLDAQRLRKVAQVLDATGKLARVLLETSNKELENNPGLGDSLAEEIESLSAETEELKARADAIRAANPDVFIKDEGEEPAE
jgi:hypothetical protein